MSSKTKIVVLHMKEVIYTIIFVVLAILLAVLLFMMFGKDRKADSAATSAAVYHAGVYKSPITLNGNTFDVEVTVDENHINAISLVNLSETTTAMYPLMRSPARSTHRRPRKTLPIQTRTNTPRCFCWTPSTRRWTKQKWIERRGRHNKPNKKTGMLRNIPVFFCLLIISVLL